MKHNAFCTFTKKTVMTAEITHHDAYKMAANIVLGIRNSLLTSLNDSNDNFNSSCSEEEESNEIHVPENVSKCTEITSPVIAAGSSYNMKKGTSERHLNDKQTNKSKSIAVSQKNKDDSYLIPCKFLLHKENVSRDQAISQIPLDEKHASIPTEVHYVKQCPFCYEINEKDANWCMECGKAILSIKIQRHDSLHIISNNKMLQSAHTRHHTDNDNSKGCNENEKYLHSAFDNLYLTNLDVKKSVCILDQNNNTFQTNMKTSETYNCEGDGNTAMYSQQICDEKLSKVPCTFEEKLPINMHNLSFVKDRNLIKKSDMVPSDLKLNTSSQWNLPEEIILHIFYFLDISSLAACVRVCKQFHRIASDLSLWESIAFKNKKINDNIVCKIARKYPQFLSLHQCNTKETTKEGFHYLFYTCSQSLKFLDVSSSCGGESIAVSVLLETCRLCDNICSFDFSWTDVEDKGVQTICQASKTLLQLSLNGCQRITDASLKIIAKRHSETLERLEIFGCFHVSPLSINILSFKCKGLRILNLGQCYKVTDMAIVAIARGLPKLESFDVRGCKKVTDTSLCEISRKCPLLSTVVLANCPAVTDSTLVNLASDCLPLKCLDVRGVRKITDAGIETLVKSCCMLRSLDLSSTKVTCRSVVAISNNCACTLESLKLSFCHSITNTCLHTLVCKCKKLRSMHLYGVCSLHNLDKLVEINPRLEVKYDSTIKHGESDMVTHKPFWNNIT